jgi:superfamily I DNA and/or RNA helicase
VPSLYAPWTHENGLRLLCDLYLFILGHFSTVFVDEAGHGWEPEVLAAFAGLLSEAGQLVLAGDPQQLGPIVRSDAVDDAHGGLSVSLLQRLIGTHPAYVFDPVVYQESAGYDSHVLTKLIKCYRCHPDILKLPNELFYASALEAAGDPSSTHNMCTWAGLPTRNFPLIFHGIEGENVQESTSPSWFNIAEVEQVFHYVRDLVDSRTVPASEIAVIAPYHKQVTKIAQLLRNPKYQKRYTDIMVGTCEKMQGQERRVIIISTVRSSADFLDEDRFFNLGFVANPKRFNVAVTRAKALLIVVGNPNVLVRDGCWGALLRSCVQRGGYTGCALPAEAGGAPPDAGADEGDDSSDDGADGPGGAYSHQAGDELDGVVAGLGQVHLHGGPVVADAAAGHAHGAAAVAQNDGGEEWEYVEGEGHADWGPV